MWQVEVGRQEFVELLQRDLLDARFSVPNHKDKDGLKKGDIRLLWPSRPGGGELPVGLVVREGEVEDFFAWTNTYLPNWSPISAYFRVFSDNQLLLSDMEIDTEGKRLLDAASIGLTVAEALGQSSESYDVDRVAMSGYIATFSYAASQGVRRNVEMTEVAREWSNCRALTNQSALRIEVESMLAPWETVAECVSGPGRTSGGASRRGKRKLFVEGLREVVDKGEIGETTWKRLTTGFPSARHAVKPMKGTQEERVFVLERVLGSRTNRGHRYSDENSFVAGYLGSRIFPGTIKHAGLVLKHLEEYPSAVLWLGLFAGLHEKRELNLSSLGRHVWRTLAGDASILSRPRCDVGIRELRVLVEGGVFGAQYRTATPGRLVVELYPCVDTVVRWPANDGVRELRSQGELFAKGLNEIGGVAKNLKRMRKDLDDTIRQIERWMHRTK